MDLNELRAKYKRFRILVIGRANAGKTTILKAVCGSTENGKVIPSSERGEHDINDELVFSSNEGFVFHDSCGFEAGSTEEVTAMREFLVKRETARSLDEKLHAIWYCIPTDNARLLTAAELTFFDECNPNGVPVILIFTKFDALDSIAFAKLRREGKLIEEAEAEAPQYAQENFKTELPRFKNRKFPAKGIVYLRNMHEEGQAKQCSEIIQLTTDNLGNQTLQRLLVSVQRVNLRLCVKYALQSNDLQRVLLRYTEQVMMSFQDGNGGRTAQRGGRWIQGFRQQLQALKQHFSKKDDMWPKLVLMQMLGWFPHIWIHDDAHTFYNDGARAAAAAGAYDAANDAAAYNVAAANLKLPHKATYLSEDLSLSHNFHPLYWGVCCAIIAEHSFWLYIRSSSKSDWVSSMKASTQMYKKLHIARSIAHSINEAFSHQASAVCDFFSDDYYHSTSVQLLQITLDNLIHT